MNKINISQYTCGSIDRLTSNNQKVKVDLTQCD